MNLQNNSNYMSKATDVIKSLRLLQNEILSIKDNEMKFGVVQKQSIIIFISYLEGDALLVNKYGINLKTVVDDNNELFIDVIYLAKNLDKGIETDLDDVKFLKFYEILHLAYLLYAGKKCETERILCLNTGYTEEEIEECLLLVCIIKFLATIDNAFRGTLPNLIGQFETSKMEEDGK